MTGPTFVWLEIAGPGPSAGPATMTIEDWHRVIEEAAALGVAMVQFIGGEPALPTLADHALQAGMEVEVLSDLVRVPARLPRVRLTTSYYSDELEEHESRIPAVRAGRGTGHRPSGVDALCGGCAQGKVAIGPTGDVWPCVFARWLPVGNVRVSPLQEIVTGPALRSTTDALRRAFEERNAAPCGPRRG
ncbi:SPASM domain-containing protein [Pseudonocardia sp. CA-107938]|uniref:SPASM domain-containing protein n=1 Tax=Pseudonocardia sp. CA-107938 TaxID=3240021 RepID=UPI003D93D679